MHSELNAHLAFHLTGMRSADAAAPMEGLQLRPALLAGHRDLARLRYDFPLVLVDDAADGDFVHSLSGLVDEAVQNCDDVARARALRREREIRAQLAATPARSLADAWQIEPPLAAQGVLADCDATLPARFLYSAWTAVQAGKRRRFHEAADRLIVELSNILAADFARSDEGRTAENLASSLAVRDDSFDTAALSRLLSRALPERRLPGTRRRRIRALLATLKGQRFFAGTEGGAGAKGYASVFYSCAAALQAMRERRNATIELSKAFAAARLEARGEYVEAVHDAVFHELAENAIDPALVPDYLVCLNAGNLKTAAEAAGLAELIASGMPVKILVQHDDLLENHSRAAAQAQLIAGMALGLNDVFVLQTVASNLYSLRSRVLKGFQYDGAALFNVYSGAGVTGVLPPYLAAAAAMESRAFPAFSYDPSLQRPERFSLENNPQPEADWPVHALDFEDAGHQSMREEVAFTLVDFAACDRRYGAFFALAENARAGVPTLRMVDEANTLRTVLVAEPLVREAARCLDAWHALRARAARPAAAVQTPVEAPAAAPEPVAAAPEAAKAPPAGDAPYIETPRCTTCEECVKINNRLFVYDANKQAYIADLKAGSFKDLVEAAENCQVSIIHPGKPLDPNEPGLADLIERAKPFL